MEAGHGGPAGRGIDVDPATLPLRVRGRPGRRRSCSSGSRPATTRRRSPHWWRCTARWCWASAGGSSATGTTSRTRSRRRSWCWCSGPARSATPGGWARGCTASPDEWRCGRGPRRSGGGRVRILSGPPAIAEEPAVRPASRAEGDDVLEVIDEEVARLPARYREAVVLCDLEGRSYAEAARRLSCPLGTLQSRLARGRARLRTRLVSRGVAPLALTAILAEGARAAVPEALAEATDPGGDRRGGLGDRRRAGRFRGEEPGHVHGQECRGGLDPGLVRAGRGPAGRRSLLAEPPGPAPAAGPTVRPRQRSAAAATAQSRPHAQAGGGRRRRHSRPGRRVGLGPRHPGSGPDFAGHHRRRGPLHRSRSRPRRPHFLQVVVAHPGFAPIELRWAGDEPIPEPIRWPCRAGCRSAASCATSRAGRSRGAGALASRGDAPAGRASPLSRAGERDRRRVDRRPGPMAIRGPARLGGTRRPARARDHASRPRRRSSRTSRPRPSAHFAAVAVMKTGRSVSGTVLSPTGRPVAGATVVVQSHRHRGGASALQTDASGRFRTGPFIDPSWDEFTLTVQADGFASAMRRLTVTPEIPPQVVRLSPRRPLQGRVVDAQGRPIPGAAVALDHGIRQRRARLGGRDRRRRPVRLVRGAGHRHGPARRRQAAVPADPGPPGRRRVGRGHDHPAPPAAPARHGHRRRDRPADRAVHRSSPAGARTAPAGRPDWLRGSARTFTGGRFDLPGGLSPTRAIAARSGSRPTATSPAEFLGLPRQRGGHRPRLQAPQGRAARGDRPRPRRPPARRRRCGPERGATTTPASRTAGWSPIEPSARRRTRRPTRRPLYASARQGSRVSVIAVHDAGFAIRSPDRAGRSTDITLAPWGRIEGVAEDRHRGRQPGRRRPPGCSTGVPRPGRLRGPDRRIGPVRLRAGRRRAG